MFMILLRDDTVLPARDYGDLVQETLGIPGLEARLRIRKGRGIFLENLEEEAARTIARRLEGDGIPSDVIDEDRLPELPAPTRVSRIQRNDPTFEVRTMDEETTSIPWEGIGLVSCGLVARGSYKETHPELRLEGIPGFDKIENEQDREIVRENLILKAESTPGPKRVIGRDRDRTVFEWIEDSEGDRIQVWLDLLTADFGTWLRISMDNVSYAATKGAVQLGACWAFDSVLTQLRKAVPEAFTEMTLKILSERDPTRLLFSQVEAFNRHTRWEAFRKALRLEPEPPLAESDPSWPGPL
jgi:hypothetical protein